MTIRSPDCASDQSATNQRFPWGSPSSDLINPPEWLTEFRKTVTSFCFIFFLFFFLPFILKEYDREYRWTVRWKRCTGQGLCPGAHNFHSLFRHVTVPAPAYVCQPTSSLNPILLGFLQRLHHKGIMDPSLQFQPFSLLKRMGSAAENLKFVIIVGSFWGPDLIQEPTRSHLLEQKTLLSPKKWQGLPETWVRS